MTIARESNESYTVSVDDLKVLLHEARTVEQQLERKFARMARGAAITNSKFGTISGLGLGVVAGVGMATGILPGTGALADLNAVLPFIGGAFCAAIGMVVGSFVDLHSVTRQD